MKDLYYIWLWIIFFTSIQYCILNGLYADSYHGDNISTEGQISQRVFSYDHYLHQQTITVGHALVIFLFVYKLY